MNPHRRIVACIALALAGAVAPLATIAAPIPGQGSWETTLLARDADRDGTVDAYFDTRLGITWLSQANPAGPTNWFESMNWATTLIVQGVDHWRLPSDFSWGGEMADLYYTTLGNPTPGIPGNRNTGPFDWLEDRSLNFWSNNDQFLPPQYAGTHAWYFSLIDGPFSFDSKQVKYMAWAVHDGDVFAAPEPSTVSAALLGVVLLLFSGYRQRRAAGQQARELSSRLRRSGLRYGKFARGGSAVGKLGGA